MGQYIEIVLAVLGVAVVVLGTVWVKWAKAKKLLKELAEALTYLSAVMEDDKFTDDEIRKIREEFVDVIIAAGELFAKVNH